MCIYIFRRFFIGFKFLLRQIDYKQRNKKNKSKIDMGFNGVIDRKQEQYNLLKTL